MKILIIGAGIGGLTAALALHRLGHEVEVREQAREIRALGVGINLLPHAVGVLSSHGLLDALLQAGIEAHEYVFMNPFGQRILGDARGRAAGYAHPQIAIHRGALQMILLDAVQVALGKDRVHTGSRLVGFDERDGRVKARFAAPDGSAAGESEADLMIAADGIHSVVRAHFYPDEGPPKWNGVRLWRGTTVGQPFLGGATIVKAGWTAQKFICYPIARWPDGRVLINWIADLHQDSTTLLEREDWNRPGRIDDFLPAYADWQFPFFDLQRMVRDAEGIFEFPMVDRDPLARWSFGRVTLLGDAAHPMYPIASNGASQAILDAECIAAELAAGDDPVHALQRYEAQRLPATARIVEMNRRQGPDVILDIVRERAPRGFERLEDVVPAAELETIVGRYKEAAGHRQHRPAA
ncbi:flavin-dependent oxidoreductase [Pseudorhodoferax sp.]|uniref:flavin-dependent oxidoreductase n=1 Tax=Pseudorhodoferax sp. TaxID=1993553 RepID=UPI002DD6A4C4|nr:flavin-dependent oxidoreductase [Pseudorhodoferax sp.]